VSGPGGLTGELISIFQCPRNVGAAAELDGKQHIDRLPHLVGRVGDVGIEKKQADAHGGQ
jgi:hypothetical protein